MKDSLIKQLDGLLNERSLVEEESIFDDESSSVNTNATSLNPPDSKSFHLMADKMLQAGDHAALVLDCLQDMLHNENDILERTLASLTDDLLSSVPMNSYNCNVFPLSQSASRSRKSQVDPATTATSTAANAATVTAATVTAATVTAATVTAATVTAATVTATTLTTANTSLRI